MDATILDLSSLVVSLFFVFAVVILTATAAFVAGVIVGVCALQEPETEDIPAEFRRAS